MPPASPLPMHIPDGFLSATVSLILWAIAIAAIGVALRRVGQDLGERQVPLMGVLAAAIFAGQMLNFSVAGGTSGHLLGAALATILVGPWAAIVVMTSVVSIQALVFQDGGLLALGPNLFNMAVIGVAVAYFAYTTARRLLRAEPGGILIAGATAAWLSTVIAALACGLELALSGTSPANLAVPAMGGIHMLIGLGEAAITAGALAFLYAARRDLVQSSEPAPKSSVAIWAAGLGLSAMLAALSPFASAHPDGLEWVAKQQGFLHLARGPRYRLVPDYLVPGLANKSVATIMAAAIGMLLVLGVVIGIARVRRTRTS